MCGLLGFYPKKDKKVDYNKLVILGSLNENRGTDSCGIAIGYNYRKIGLKDQSYARNFFVLNDKELKKQITINKPVIFHTRKSTYGVHNDKNAHPFQWYTENEKDSFFFAHNGTLDSYRTLIDKYNLNDSRALIDIDSHVLGLAMYRTFRNTPLTEEKVLKTYEGAAAFLCYNSSKFVVWKGAANEVEERPMWYVEDEDGWYFHSQQFALWFLFKKIPKQVKNNELLTFSNHKLKSSTIYERVIEKKVVSVSEYNDHEKYYFNTPKVVRKLKDNFLREEGVLRNIKNLRNLFTGLQEDLEDEEEFNDNLKYLTATHKGKKTPIIGLNSDIASNGYLRYTWIAAPGFPLNEPLKLESLLTNNNRIPLPYSDPKGVQFDFADGFLIKDRKIYEQVYNNFQEFVVASSKTQGFAPYNSFFNKNEHLFKNCVSDFMWFFRTEDFDNYGIFVYRRYSGDVDFITLDSVNTQIKIKSLILDKDVILSVNQYSTGFQVTLPSTENTKKDLIILDNN